MSATLDPQAAPLSWIPRAGQWVLFKNGYPWSHRTAASNCVGIYQADSPLIDPAKGQPYMVKGLPASMPRHIVPVDANGRNYRLDRTNYKTQGAVVLVPFFGFKNVDKPEDLAFLDKYFADNRLAELVVVVRLEDCGLVGPLLDQADMPPGRAVSKSWKPRA